MLLSDGEYIDGSWILTVFIDSLGIERRVRVQGDWSISKVVANLVAQLPMAPVLPHNSRHCPWNQYDLWWPNKNQWLLHPGQTVFQAGLHADTWLRFTPSLCTLRIQLPDLQVREFGGISYSEPVFRVVKAICSSLGIRHSEELSLKRINQEQRQIFHRQPTGVNTLDQVTDTLPTLARKAGTLRRIKNTSGAGSRAARPLSFNGSINSSTDLAQNGGPPPFGPPRLRTSLSGTCKSLHTFRTSTPYIVNASDPQMWASLPTIASTNQVPEAADTLVTSPLVEHGRKKRLRDFDERICVLSRGWLDSAKSLMEQGFDPYGNSNMPMVLARQIQFPTKRLPPASVTNGGTVIGAAGQEEDETMLGYEPPMLRLMFKFGNFYDLNPKLDPVRINQLYEQARWSVLAELIECNEDEAMLLAAYQLQIATASEHRRRLLQQISRQQMPSTAAVNNMAEDDGLDNLTVSTTNVMISQNSSRTCIDGVRSTHLSGEDHLGQHPNISSRVQSCSPFMGRRTPTLTAKELEQEIDFLLESLTLSCADEVHYGRVQHQHSHGRLISPLRMTSLAGSLSRSLTASPTPLDPMMDNTPHQKPTRNNQATLHVLDHDILLENDEYDHEPGHDGLANGNSTPHLSAMVRVVSARGFSLKHQRRYFMAIRESTIHIYRSEDDCQKNVAPVDSIELRSCYVEHELSLSEERFGLKLFVPFTRSTLPIASALKAGKCMNESLEDFNFIKRLRNRTSFLSLTSLVGFLAGGLGSAASFVAGMLHEIQLEFPDQRTFVEWYSLCRVAGSLVNDHMLDSKILNYENYQNELRDIEVYLDILGPCKKKPTAGTSKTSEIPVILSRHSSQFLPSRYRHRLINVGDAKSSVISIVGLHGTAKSNASLFALPPNQQDCSPAATGATTPQPPVHHHEASNGTLKRIVSIWQALPLDEQATPTELKLRYISVWQSLFRQGIVYFPARFRTTAPLSIVLSANNNAGKQFTAPKVENHSWAPFRANPAASFITLTESTKDEALGVGINRIFRCDLATGDIKASWQLKSIQGWHVNFELNEIILYVAPLTNKMRTNGRVYIRPRKDVSARMITEFLGGNAFLNLRSPSRPQDLDERNFYKLVSGSKINC